MNALLLAAISIVLQVEVGGTFPVYPHVRPPAPVAFNLVVEDPLATWDGTHFTVPEDGVYNFEFTLWIEHVSNVPCYVTSLLWKADPTANPEFGGYPIGDDAEYVTAVHPWDAYAARLSVNRTVRLQAGDVIWPSVFTEPGCDATIAHPRYESWFTITK